MLRQRPATGIAWRDGDRLAIDAVLAEAMTDPIGVPGLVFGLATTVTELADRLVVGTELMADLRDGLPEDASGDPDDAA